jgi:transcription elongation factor GreA-like protein
VQETLNRVLPDLIQASIAKSVENSVKSELRLALPTLAKDLNAGNSKEIKNSLVASVEKVVAFN